MYLKEIRSMSRFYCFARCRLACVISRTLSSSLCGAQLADAARPKRLSIRRPRMGVTWRSGTGSRTSPRQADGFSWGSLTPWRGSYLRRLPWPCCCVTLPRCFESKCRIFCLRNCKHGRNIVVSLFRNKDATVVTCLKEICSRGEPKSQGWRLRLWAPCGEALYNNIRGWFIVGGCCCVRHGGRRCALPPNPPPALFFVQRVHT